jgi:hypothetical protein
MSDHYNSLTVVLEKEMTQEEIEPIMNAIEMIKGVITTNVSPMCSENYIQKEMARHDLIKKIYTVLNA